MNRREFVKVWARYATTAFGLVYPVYDAFSFAGVPFSDAAVVPAPEPDPFKHWPIKGRVMNGNLPLTGWFSLHNDQYELKIGKMRDCHITAMDYRIKIDGEVHSCYVEVHNPQNVGDTNVTIRFAKTGIIDVEGYEIF